jgi:hypothetical protein
MDNNSLLELNSEEILIHTNYVKTLEEACQNRQMEWNNKLSPLSESLKSNNPEDISMVQSLALQFYIDIVFEIAEFQQMISLTQSKKSLSERDRFLFYTLKSKQFTDKNLSGGEKRILIDGDLNVQELHLMLLRGHLDFLNDCKYLTSNIQYAISNKIKLMNI